MSIAGPAGAGKSQLAKTVVERIGHDECARVPTDYFLNSMDNREGNCLETLTYDWDLMLERFALEIGTCTSTPDYDFSQLQRRNVYGGLPFVIRRIMITDAMEPLPGAHLKIKLSAPAAVRHGRIIQRDLDWGTRVQDRWAALGSAWKLVDDRQFAWDIVLDGTAALEQNAMLVSAEIDRTL